MNPIDNTDLRQLLHRATVSASGGVYRSPAVHPHVKWKHPDGPLLVCRDGTLHWLTWWERIGLRLGFYTLATLDRQHNSLVY